jgi:DNA-binding transcriptional regulator YdaS (Cro superfamily)
MTDIQTILSQKRGLRIELARALGITHGAVSQWKKVPADRAVQVEEITGVSRHELRPDVFGPAPQEVQP